MQKFQAESLELSYWLETLQGFQIPFTDQFIGGIVEVTDRFLCNTFES